MGDREGTEDPTHSALQHLKMSVEYRLLCQVASSSSLLSVGMGVIIGSHYNSSINHHVLSISHVDCNVLHYRAFCT